MSLLNAQGLLLDTPNLLLSNQDLLNTLGLYLVPQFLFLEFQVST